MRLLVLIWEQSYEEIIKNRIYWGEFSHKTLSIRKNMRTFATRIVGISIFTLTKNNK